MKKVFTIFSLLLIISFTKINAQNFWKRTNENTLSARSDLFEKSYKPTKFVSFQLDEDAFRAQLQSAPSEKTVAAGKSTFIISVPVASGNVERFRIVEAQVMEAGLAAKHPELKSYAGQGIDDPSSTIRCDMTPEGFHAMILSGKRSTIYINPLEKSTHTYIVFDRDHLAPSKNVLSCLTQEEEKHIEGSITQKGFTDGKLRTYRFAVCCGGEFSAKIYTNGGTDAQKKAQVLAVLVTDLTRVDGIMEADFGIRLDYVSNEDTIIFLDGTTDPFLSNANGINGTWNTQCQSACDTYIGSANYDIGHVLMGYLTGGNAYAIGSVCRLANKGTGATGFTYDLTTDPFVVDFWIHEIGHQFGDNHTFDFSYEGTGAQMEPGSGITIMGYAGVTGRYDDSTHSIGYFHTYNIQQTQAYVTTGAGSGCGLVTPTGDATPTVNAGADFIVPNFTPFEVAGIATDADATDVLTYDWEEFDVYKNNGTSSAIPKSTSTTGPQFRCYNATVSTIRSFPALQYILNGANNYKWEVLPSVARPLNFRLTVRDNHPGGGQDNTDDMVVTVDGNSGPFKVNIANTSGVVLTGNSHYTVTWDVANTIAAPVNCADVAILLSTDGGNTFTYPLAAATPNIGSAIVVVPNINSTTCRIKIKAVGNIFFDINDANFSITASLPLSWLSFTGQLKGAVTLLNWTTANEVNNNYFSVERSTDAEHYQSIGAVTATARAAATNPYSFTDKNPLVGTDFYRLQQFDKDGNYHYSPVVKVTVNKNGSWVVYPNPATTATTVAVKSDLNNVFLSLSNAGGQMVYNISLQKASAGQTINVPVSNLAKGVYVLKIKSDEGLNSEKIVVE